MHIIEKIDLRNPYNLYKMAPSRISIQNSIREKTNSSIDMVQLVMYIIEIYGGDSKTDTDSNHIYAKESHRYITEEYLDDILSVLLTSEGKDIAMAINNNQEFSNKFTFHYNSIEGEGIVSLK